MIDEASHALAFVGSALATRNVPLGVDRFGQTGSQPELYHEHEIDPGAIATACLAALDPEGAYGRGCPDRAGPTISSASIPT